MKKQKEVNCKKCKHYLIYRDNMAYYESDKYLCVLSDELNPHWITKCSRYEENV